MSGSKSSNLAVFGSHAAEMSATAIEEKPRPRRIGESFIVNIVEVEC